MIIQIIFIYCISLFIKETTCYTATYENKNLILRNKINIFEYGMELDMSEMNLGKLMLY